MAAWTYARVPISEQSWNCAHFVIMLGSNLIMCSEIAHNNNFWRRFWERLAGVCIYCCNSAMFAQWVRGCQIFIGLSVIYVDFHFPYLIWIKKAGIGQNFTDSCYQLKAEKYKYNLKVIVVNYCTVITEIRHCFVPC